MPVASARPRISGREFELDGRAGFRDVGDIGVSAEDPVEDHELHDPENSITPQVPDENYSGPPRSAEVTAGCPRFGHSPGARGATEA